jgi:hypothetical protein
MAAVPADNSTTEDRDHNRVEATVTTATTASTAIITRITVSSRSSNLSSCRRNCGSVHDISQTGTDVSDYAPVRPRLDSRARLGKGRPGCLLNEIVKYRSRTDSDNAGNNASNNKSSHANSPSFATKSRSADAPLDQAFKPKEQKHPLQCPQKSVQAIQRGNRNRPFEPAPDRKKTARSRVQDVRQRTHDQNPPDPEYLR